MQLTYTSGCNGVIISCGKRKHLFRLSELVRFEARSNYTVIHSTSQRPLVVAKILSDYEAEFLPKGFIRTHRSHLVNKQYVVNLDASGNLVLHDQTKIEVSRRKKKDVYASLVNA